MRPTNWEPFIEGGVVIEGCHSFRSTLGVFWLLILALHVDDTPCTDAVGSGEPRVLHPRTSEAPEQSACLQQPFGDEVPLLGWSSRLRPSREQVRTLSSGSTWPE